MKGGSEIAVISYPIESWSRVLEAACKHDFCSELLPVVILQPFTNHVSSGALSGSVWAAGWGHRGVPDPLPQPSWHRMEPCTSTPRQQQRHFPGCTLGLQNSTFSARGKAVGMWGCSINPKSSCKDPSAQLGVTLQPRGTEGTWPDAVLHAGLAHI